MKRIHLGVGALVWIGVWLVATTLRDRGHAVSAPPPPLLQPPRGETVAATCAGCHSLERVEPGVGPHLVGIVGRAAASVDGYDYSVALRRSGLVWTRARLREFLQHPETLVPGTRMALSGWPADDVDAVIDYLAAPPHTRDTVEAQSPQGQGRSASP